MRLLESVGIRQHEGRATSGVGGALHMDLE